MFPICFLHLVLISLDIPTFFSFPTFTSPTLEKALTSNLKLYQNCTIYLASKKLTLSFLESDEHDLVYSLISASSGLEAEPGARKLGCVVASNPYLSRKHLNQFVADSQMAKWFYKYHHEFFLKLFAKHKFGNTCTVLVKLPSSQGEIRNITFFQYLGVTRSIFSMHQNLQGNPTIQYPEYTLVISNLSLEFVNRPAFTIQLPTLFQRTKLLVIFCAKPDIIYIACFTCPKILPRDAYVRPYALTALLLQTTQKLESLTELSILWSNINLENWNNFGSPKTQNIPRNENCPSGCLANRRKIEFIDIAVIKDCMRRYILDRKNCSYCNSIDFFAPLLVEKPKPGNPSVSLDDIGGPNWIYHQYFLILSNTETKKQIAMDFQKFLKPFHSSVWYGFAITFITVNVILVALELKHVSFNMDWTLWLIAVLFEQGGDAIKCNLTKFNHSILIVWTFYTLLCRNFYGFSMYSDLTAEVTPLNLPHTKHVLANTSNLTIFVQPYVEEMIRDAEETLETGTLKQLYGRLADRVCVRSQTHFPNSELVKRISSFIPLECRPVELRNSGRKSPQFSTLKRVAFIDVLDFHVIMTALSNRTFFMPLNSMGMGLMPYLVLWKPVGAFYIREEYHREIKALVETGIQKHFEYWYGLIRLVKLVKEYIKILGGKINRNVYGYLLWYRENHLKKDILRGASFHETTLAKEDNENERATIQEFRLVLVLYTIFSGFCVSIFMIENVFYSIKV